MNNKHGNCDLQEKNLQKDVFLGRLIQTSVKKMAVQITGRKISRVFWKQRGDNLDISSLMTSKWVSALVFLTDVSAKRQYLSRFNGASTFTFNQQIRVHMKDIKILHDSVIK